MNLLIITASYIILHGYAANPSQTKWFHKIDYVHDPNANTIKIIDAIKKMPHTQCYWYRNTDKRWQRIHPVPFPRRNAIIQIPNDIRGQLRIQCYAPPHHRRDQYHWNAFIQDNSKHEWVQYARMKGHVAYNNFGSHNKTHVFDAMHQMDFVFDDSAESGPVVTETDEILTNESTTVLHEDIQELMDDNNTSVQTSSNVSHLYSTDLVGDQLFVNHESFDAKITNIIGACIFVFFWIVVGIVVIGVMVFILYYVVAIKRSGRKPRLESASVLPDITDRYCIETGENCVGEFKFDVLSAEHLVTLDIEKAR